MKHFKTANWLHLTFCLILLGNIATAQETPVLTDSVKVLPLTEKLTARGQLGGLTVDRLGFIYVANFRDAVWKVSPQGDVTLLTDGLYGSSGNAIDAHGDLYQANFFSHSIHRIDRFGNISTFIESGLNGPVGLVFDSKGHLYVCNFSKNNILRITPDRQTSVFASGDTFNGPNGITIDPQNNLYVVNFNNNNVVRISPNGQAEVFATVPGVDGNAHIAHYNGNCYISKIKSNRIYQANGKGEVKLLAGNGQTAITEGAALQAAFSAPNGIAADALTGAIYVNNVNGKWTGRQPSTIDISVIHLATIQAKAKRYIEQGNLEGARQAVLDYHRDPFHEGEDIGPPLSALGWQNMVARNVPASLMLFGLVTEIYPSRWRPYFNLAEVYKIIGQREKAVQHYQLALEKQPDNATVISKLQELQQAQ